MAQDGEPEPSPAPEQTQDDIEVDAIIVIGARLAGTVESEQPPLLELDADDIAAYGVGSIAELLEQLGPTVTSGRGRGDGAPVILVNGVRIGSFRELRSYPPEAIERTEVFSEEVAQQYGYSPDQRVVNIILKDNYQSIEFETEYSQPFDGGFSQQEAETTYLRIDGRSRLNANLEFDNTSPLTEGERDIIQADGSQPTFATDPGPADFRTLVADARGYEATLNWVRTLDTSGTSLSLNATYERDERLSLQGLDSVLLTDPLGETALRTFNAVDPLAVDSVTDSYSAAATFNTDIADWEITATADATLSDSLSLTDLALDTDALVLAAAAGDLALDADFGTFGDAGFERAESDTYTVNALVTARGNPVLLPAGELSTTLIAGYRANGIESVTTGDIESSVDLDRTRWQGGINLGIPITSRSEGFGGALGDISLNLNGGVLEQSDFGTLTDWSAGITWGIFADITLAATYVERESSPSLTQLGAPQIVTQNVPVFDFTTGDTVLATVTSGGNPDLPAQQQNDWIFRAIWELPEFADFLDNGTFQVEYFDNSSRDTTSGFPFLTPAIEAAFADRVTRNDDGRLTALDRRFVTYAEQDTRSLRFGLNLRGSFGEPDEETQERPAGEARGRPGSGGSEGRRGPPNAERFAQIRAQFCEAEPDVLLERFQAAADAAANGEDPPVGEDGEPISLPPRLLERLTGEDGRIDPERFNALRERFCSGDGPPAGARGGGEGGPQARGEGRRGGGGGRRGGGRGIFGAGDGPPVWRWFANLNYTVALENTVLIAEGIDRLDLLNGDALSSTGNPRHSVRWRSGLFYDGYGAFIFGDYTGSSRITGSDVLGTSSDLFFDDFVRIDLRTFVDLGQRDGLVEAVPFFKNVRVGFDIENIFDARQRVTDGNGDTPLAYQPFLLDPRGRTFELEFRKLF
ncbi:hypothetical protein [Aurantiacibacter aquimixticola]|nr:hypothetical protein [Aurantiacibacter aquimixticola]